MGSETSTQGTRSQRALCLSKHSICPILSKAAISLVPREGGGDQEKSSSQTALAPNAVPDTGEGLNSAVEPDTGPTFYTSETPLSALRQ